MRSSWSARKCLRSCMSPTGSWPCTTDASCASSLRPRSLRMVWCRRSRASAPGTSPDAGRPRRILPYSDYSSNLSKPDGESSYYTISDSSIRGAPGGTLRPDDLQPLASHREPWGSPDRDLGAIALREALDRSGAPVHNRDMDSRLRSVGSLEAVGLEPA